MTRLVATITALVALAGLLAPTDCLYTWQGFDHGWQRHVLDVFETPHRLGSTANYLLAGDNAANMTMTPGVNGDYAHPRTYFSQTNASALVYRHFNVSWSFTDNATYAAGSKRLEANSTLSTTAKFYLPGAAQATAVLDGWRLDMHCDPAAQPAGRVCNSNGVWPSKLLVDVAGCSYSAQSAVLTCNVTLTLNRGWTPTFGGDKAFNYVMSYTYYAYVLVLGSAQPLAAVQTDLLVDRNDIHDAPLQAAARLAVAPGYPAALLGLAGFGFTMQETDDFHQLGRYLERLVFALPSYQYDPAQAALTYNYTVGYYAPITTLPSLVDYVHRVVVVQYQDVVQPRQSSVAGSVCINDETTYFSCTVHRIPDRTNDVVNLPNLLN